ncbi:MAG: hypothetical protein PF503_16620 [Desulfobacula sp.]|nr:hypothetical protein [Desulfobacula sp.]
MKIIKPSWHKKKRTSGNLKKNSGGTPEQQSVQTALEFEIKEMFIQQSMIMIRALNLEMNRHEIENRTADVQIKLSKEQEAFVRANIHNDREDLNHQLDLIRKKNPYSR